jgi:hypothetical protein
MSLVINGSSVYNSQKRFITYFINGKKVRNWLQIFRLLFYLFFTVCRGAASAARTVEFAPTGKSFSKLPRLEKRQNSASCSNAPQISP